MIWNDELYLIDYQNNCVFTSNDKSVTQYILQINLNELAYHNDTMLYKYDLKTKISDSIPLDLNKFEKTEIRIIEKNNGKYYAYVLAFLITSAFSYFLYRGIRKEKRGTTSKDSEKNSFDVKFSNIEKSLLLLLIKKAEENDTVLVDEINYIIGVKDKSIGLQKKIRSSTVNGINEKFSMLFNNNGKLIEKKKYRRQTIF